MSKRLPFLASLIVFAGWVGYLGYLAATEATAPVRAPAAALTATVEVVADLTADEKGAPDSRIQVRSVTPLAGDPAGLTAGAEVTVGNLPSAVGFIGIGTYRLPLIRDGTGYRIPLPPRSPGFDPNATHVKPRIFPARP